LTKTSTKLCAHAFQNKKSIKPLVYKGILSSISSLNKRNQQLLDGKLKTGELEDFLAKSAKDIELAKTYLEKK
jgi:hypothetical protein